MDKKYVIPVLFSFIVITFVSISYSGTIPSSYQADSNIIVRNNEYTTLKNFNVVVNVTVKETKSAMMGYLTYEKNFFGEFILYNNGPKDEEIVLAYPLREQFYGYSSCDNYERIERPRPPRLSPSNITVLIDGENVAYDVVCAPSMSSYSCGQWENGSSFCQRNVKELQCSKTEGPFIEDRSNCKTIHTKDGSETTPDSPCTGENPCTTVCNKISFCLYLNNTFSCECQDTGMNYPDRPRFICEKQCYLRQCNEDSCSLCKDIDCITPYDNDLIGIRLVKFKLVIPKGDEKSILIKYNNDYGEDVVSFDFYDQFSWKNKISGTIIYNIIGGKIEPYSQYVKEKFENYTYLMPIYESKDNVNSYIWKLDNVDTTIYGYSSIRIWLTEDNSSMIMVLSISVVLIIVIFVLYFLLRK